jgi:AcrR family transcriptional regulator
MSQLTQEQKLDSLLAAAARVFAARGYHSASMRDLAQESAISLSGIYYYVRGKDELLYLIQSRTLDALLGSLAESLAGSSDPHQRLLRFIQNHLAYFDHHAAPMRVLTHEPGALREDHLQTVNAKKREYTNVHIAILQELDPERKSRVDQKLAADCLFAMLNGPNQWGIADTQLNVGEMAQAVYRLFTLGFTARSAD